MSTLAPGEKTDNTAYDLNQQNTLFRGGCGRTHKIFPVRVLQDYTGGKTAGEFKMTD